MLALATNKFSSFCGTGNRRNAATGARALSPPAYWPDRGRGRARRFRTRRENRVMVGSARAALIQLPFHAVFAFPAVLVIFLFKEKSVLERGSEN